MDSQEEFNEILNKFRDADSADRENRDYAINDLEFLIGEQWSDQDKMLRKSERRVTLTINRLPQFVRQVTSDLIQLNPSINIRPVDGESDKDLAQIWQSIVREIERNSCSDFVYTQAGINAARCGMGNFRVTTEYEKEDSFDQIIALEALPDPFCVYWDPVAKHPTRKDAEYCFVVQDIPKKQFEKLYPKEEISSFASYDYSSQMGWMTQDKVRIAEYWYKVPHKKEIAILKNGQVVDLEQLEPEAIEVLEESDSILRRKKVETNKVYQQMVSGAGLIGKRKEFPSRHIPIIFVAGEEVTLGERVVRKSVIRDAKDAQVMYNYARSAMAEHIAIAPKAPYLVTPDQVAGHEDVWRQANRRNFPYIPYNPTQDAPAPQRLTPPDASSGLIQEVMSANEDLKATIGIYDAALGSSTGQEVSGKAINARKAESDIVSLTFVQNLEYSIEQAGRIIIDLIPKIYDSQRMIRVIGDRGQVDKVVTINEGRFDLSRGRYDVEIEMGANTATEREQMREALLQFMAINPAVANVLGDVLVESFSWKEAPKMAERLARMVPEELRLTEEELAQKAEQAAQPTPEQQLSLQMLEEQIKRMQVETSEKLANIQKIAAQTVQSYTTAEKSEFDIAKGIAEMNQQNMMQYLTPEAIALLNQVAAQTQLAGDDFRA